MLSALPATQVRALYPDRASFVQRSGGGPRSLAELRSVLTRTRTDGYAREEGTVTADLSSVAVPVLDRAGRPLAAIALTLRTPDASAEHVAELVARARLAADDIARRLSPSASSGRRGQ
jgi:DNA-binding IclR family transcriptional regulator